MVLYEKNYKAPSRLDFRSRFFSTSIWSQTPLHLTMTEDHILLTFFLLSILLFIAICGAVVHWKQFIHHVKRAFHFAAMLTLAVITLMSLEHTLRYYTNALDLVGNLMTVGFMSYLTVQLFCLYYKNS